MCVYNSIHAFTHTHIFIYIYNLYITLLYVCMHKYMHTTTHVLNTRIHIYYECIVLYSIHALILCIVHSYRVLCSIHAFILYYECIVSYLIHAFILCIVFNIHAFISQYTHSRMAYIFAGQE